MAGYENDAYPRRPLAHENPFSDGQSRSNLRDPFDRFGSPAPAHRDSAPAYGGPAPAYESTQAYGSAPAYGSSPSYGSPANDFSSAPSRAGYSQPPEAMYMTSPPKSRRAAFNPRTWSRRTWILVAVAALLALIAVIVGSVEGVKASAYPDYTSLTYSLTDTYAGADFFDNFVYWDTYDPSQGFVHYDNPTDSASRNTTFASATSAVLRVDNTEANATTGRHSARISSNKTYDSGLFIFDVLHAPYGCATWPAVWLTNQDVWPLDGEIDVIEAVNQGASGNQMTLHTTSGCSMSVRREQTGSTVHTDCYNGTDANAGCGVSGATATYGAALNANGGGVYAMELRSAGIRVWFFPRASIPADVAAGTSPSPSTWGEALADFPSTDCDIGSHFKNLSIVANVDVCGAWAGASGVYSTLDNCPGDCTTYAAQNPAAFDEAYWEFASFKVYSAA